MEVDGCSAEKSTPLKTLVIQNTTNINDLKAKLNGIVNTGKEYQYDVSSCIKSLLNNTDQEIVLLTVTAISELVKCEEKRKTYAQSEIIEPLLDIVKKDVTPDNLEIIKQSCRSLGNLCCDCDESREIMQKHNGIAILINLIKRIEQNNNTKLEELNTLAGKTLLNYAIGGESFVKVVLQEGAIDIIQSTLNSELEKDDINDDLVATALLLLNVIEDNTLDMLCEAKLNVTVLNILRLTANMDICEYCLEHLHLQAEHESVKTLLAEHDGVQLVCTRLEQLVPRHEAGDLYADDVDVESVMKLACDLIIIVLHGDEAMHMLFDYGVGPVYTCMVRWLDSPIPLLLTTATLALGNFARQDDYCKHMMGHQIFDKLLDIFEVYHGIAVSQKNEEETSDSIDNVTLTKIQHATLSAIRNLIVSVENKQMAAEGGRAAPLLINALPHVEEYHVAYKLIAAIRMLVDKQESVARLYLTSRASVAAAAVWRREEHGPAGDEAARLLAWALRTAPADSRLLLQVDGCVSSLVSMLVSSHTVMQNEAILALMILAAQTIDQKPSEPTEFDFENGFVQQLVESEIGKHISVLIETNCAKMPVEVAENLLSFLKVVTKKGKIAADLKVAKIDESLQKFTDGRQDLGDDLKGLISSTVQTISKANRTK